MSYDLTFEYAPSVKTKNIQDYFLGRRNYKASHDEFFYENEETGVYFLFKFQENNSNSSRYGSVNGHFNINFCRPSFFGLEAQKELSSIIAEFPCKIHDPQMHGMDNGPYSDEGFLRGWNAGNRFGVQAILSQSKSKIWSLPKERLRETWQWNYDIPVRSATYGERQFIPRIVYFGIRDVAQTVVVWGDGMPALLPKVDFVLMGRSENGPPSFSLTSWETVSELLRGIGIKEESYGFNLDYMTAPIDIQSFIKNMLPTENSILTRISADNIFDDDLISDIRNSKQFPAE